MNDFVGFSVLPPANLVFFWKAKIHGSFWRQQSTADAESNFFSQHNAASAEVMGAAEAVL